MAPGEISIVLVRVLPKHKVRVRFPYLAPTVLYTFAVLIYTVIRFSTTAIDSRRKHIFMHIPKQYFHDKSVLGLIGFNAALLVLTVANVLLNVDTELNSVSIVSYRSSRAIQTSGPTSSLYEFALFAVVVTVVSVILSIRLYGHRKHLAISILGLNVVSLLLCLVVFNALTRTL